MTRFSLKICGKLEKRHGKFGKIMDKLLTILIPTRNRFAPLSQLLDLFASKKIASDVEILLAVNASDDGSLSLAKNFQQKIPNLKIKYFENFVHSAEENINRSIKYCSGKYVFILGDDDNLFWGVVELLMSILRNDQSNLPVLVFNNISSLQKSFDFREKIEGVNWFSGGEIDDKLFAYSSYGELLKHLGVITIMAFISRYVIRKDLLKDFSSHIERSRIYSHVFAFLEFFQNEQVLLVNLPIVSRGLSLVGKEFAAMSKAATQPNRFHWHHGLLLHINNAVKNKIVPSSWFFEIKEFNDGDVAFDLCSNTLSMICLQVSDYLCELDRVEMMSIEALDIILGFDDRVLPSRNRKILRYVLSELEEIVLETSKSTLSKRGIRFLKWRVKKIQEMISWLSNKIRGDEGVNKKNYKVNGYCCNVLNFAMKSSGLFSERLFLFLKKMIKKIEMKSF